LNKISRDSFEAVTPSADQLDPEAQLAARPRHHQDIASGPTVM
jgi:hypothetical protein